MNGRTLHGWRDAWRLTWSFLWRQALALLLGSALLGALLGALSAFKIIGPAFLINTMGFLTVALIVASAAVAFRLLLAKFEVRAPETRQGRGPSSS